MLGDVVDDPDEAVGVTGDEPGPYVQGTLVAQAVEDPEALFVVAAGERSGDGVAYAGDVVGVDPFEDAFQLDRKSVV